MNRFVLLVFAFSVAAHAADNQILDLRQDPLTSEHLVTALGIAEQMGGVHPRLRRLFLTALDVKPWVVLSNTTQPATRQGMLNVEFSPAAFVNLKTNDERAKIFVHEAVTGMMLLDHQPWLLKCLLTVQNEEECKATFGKDARTVVSLTAEEQESVRKMANLLLRGAADTFAPTDILTTFDRLGFRLRGRAYYDFGPPKRLPQFSVKRAIKRLVGQTAMGFEVVPAGLGHKTRECGHEFKAVNDSLAIMVDHKWVTLTSGESKVKGLQGYWATPRRAAFIGQALQLELKPVQELTPGFTTKLFFTSNRNEISAYEVSKGLGLGTKSKICHFP
jgi:hypothetical protein